MAEEQQSPSPLVFGELVGFVVGDKHSEKHTEELSEDEYLALLTALYCD